LVKEQGLGCTFFAGVELREVGRQIGALEAMHRRPFVVDEVGLTSLEV
jgi:hypothetical protein